MSSNALSVRQGLPKDADELLWVCRLEIAGGNFENAKRIARQFCDAAAGGTATVPIERYRRMSYAWYVLCLAAYRVCRMAPEAEFHDRLRTFFVCHKTATWYVLKCSQDSEFNIRSTSRESTIRDDIEQLYDAVYRTWGKELAGKADLEAVREVSV